MSKHRKGVNVHPLILGETLAHTQHGEEISRNSSVQFCYGHWLIKQTHRNQHCKLSFNLDSFLFHSLLILNKYNFN